MHTTQTALTANYFAPTVTRQTDIRSVVSCISFPVAQQPNSDLGRLIVEVSRSYTPDTTPLEEGSARH